MALFGNAKGFAKDFAKDLFTSKEKKEAIAETEEIVMQRLSKVDLIDKLINVTLNDEENPWIAERQNYYDNGVRFIDIDVDLYGVKWVYFEEEQYVDSRGVPNTRTVEKVIKKVEYSYTKSGYLPLHSFTEGEEEIPAKRVRYLWAMVVREHLMAAMPDCSFGEIKDSDDTVYFTYKIPVRVQYKDWF